MCRGEVGEGLGLRPAAETARTVAEVLRGVPVDQFCEIADVDADLVRTVARRIASARSVAVLEDLAAHADVEASLAAPRRLQTVLPRAVVDDDGEVRLVDLVVGDPDHGG